MVDNLSGAGKLFDLAMMHDHHALTKVECLVDVVGHEEEGLTGEALVDGFEFLLQFNSGQRVQGAKWFVKENVGWISGERPCYANPLLLTAGKLTGVATGKLLWIELD